MPDFFGSAPDALDLFGRFLKPNLKDSFNWQGPRGITRILPFGEFLVCHVAQLVLIPFPVQLGDLFENNQVRVRKSAEIRILIALMILVPGAVPYASQKFRCVGLVRLRRVRRFRG